MWTSFTRQRHYVGASGHSLGYLVSSSDKVIRLVSSHRELNQGEFKAGTHLHKIYLKESVFVSVNHYCTCTFNSPFRATPTLFAESD